VTLEQVFKDRMDRAIKTLAHPEHGPRHIRFSSEDLLDRERLDHLHDKFPWKIVGTIYLYKLSLDGAKPGVSRMRSCFRRSRQRNERNMSRDNRAHSDSSALYVGTCENLYSRFRTHLGKGMGTTTWALYLSTWAAPQGKFVVEYYQFKEAEYEDVELIEGVLWDALRPLFGKKGGRGA
jgi:hypothetical protein